MSGARIAKKKIMFMKAGIFIVKSRTRNIMRIGSVRTGKGWKMNNFETAKRILKLLGVEKDNPGIIKGLTEACNDCERYGPQNGRPCMSLRLALDMGIEYTPPEWCKDKNSQAS